MSRSLESTQRLLQEALLPAEKPVAWISGGKDSLALMHLLRPFDDQVLYLHVQLDDGWPGQTENLLALAAKWGLNLQVLGPGMRFEPYTQKFGWPMEVVPTSLQGASAARPSPFYVDGPRLSPWTHCQQTRIISPLLAFCALYHADVVFTGTKEVDGRIFGDMGDWPETRPLVGWQRVNPLHHWDNDEVYAYLDAHDIPLPPHYALKRHAKKKWEWADCLSCTWKMEHWELLKTHYPEEFEKRWPKAREVLQATQRESAAFLHTLDEALIQLEL